MRPYCSEPDGAAALPIDVEQRVKNQRVMSLLESSRTFAQHLRWPHAQISMYLRVAVLPQFRATFAKGRAMTEAAMLRRNLLRQFPWVSLFVLSAFPLSLAQNVANLWVSSGGACTRASAVVAFNAGTACGSFAAAYNAASAGDTIYVKAGTYGSQSIPGRSLGTNVVTFIKEPGGAAVNVAGISIDSSNVTVDGVTSSGAFSIGHNSGCNSTPGNGWPCAFPVKNVVLRNFSATNGYITGDTVLLQNGSVGPVDGCASGKEDGIQILGLGSGVNPS